MKRVLGVLLAAVLLSALPGSVAAQTQIIARGRASTANATATPLGSGATFTGTWEDTRDYTLVTVSVFANQNSSAGGWKLQWSSDATNLDVEDTFTVTASIGQSQTSPTKARYFRVSYVNSASAQATFRLATTFRQAGGPPGPNTVSTGGLTDTQLRATAVPVSGTVTANVGSGTQPVSGTVTANAGTGTFIVGDGAGALNVIVDSGSTVVTQGTGTNLHTVVDSGAVTNTPPANQSVNNAQVVGTAIDVNSGTKSAGTQRIVIATDQPALTNALKVDGSAVTQPVSGTVTTTPPSNASTNVAQMAGTAVSMNTGVRDAGTQRVTVATNDSVPVTGTVTVTDGSGALNVIVDSGTTTVTQATAANLNAQVQGAGATGAAKAGNPVQIGGVFNTTQPTVTNGQGVEAQSTARGAQIVAPGVDGFAVTGTVTTTPPSNASTNLTQIVGTAADVNSGNKSAGTLRVVLATDQPALTNKLLVTPDSVALPANQSVNAAQLAGTTTDTNSGNKSAGTLRVVLATDQPALTNKILVTPDSVALPANQSVNVAQMGGTATSMNTGVRDAGTQRVTIATNDSVPVTLGANQSVNIAQMNGVTTSMGNGAVDTGTQRVSLAQRRTYAASTTLKTATAAGTGPFFTICGSATQTIRIQQFIVSGTVATAAVWGDVVLKKTSAATSAGTATALTKVPLDSNSAAATANAVNYYTVLATAGTLVGAVASQTTLFPVTAISATLQPTPAPLEFKWRDQDSESPVLRGTAQCMEANFGTTTTNAPTLAVSVKWTEE